MLRAGQHQQARAGGHQRQPRPRWKRAAELCKHKGAKRADDASGQRTLPLRLMQPAQDRLAADLDALTFNAPQIPVLCNVEAVPVTEAASRARH